MNSLKPGTRVLVNTGRLEPATIKAVVQFQFGVRFDVKFDHDDTTTHCVDLYSLDFKVLA